MAGSYLNEGSYDENNHLDNKVDDAISTNRLAENKQSMRISNATPDVIKEYTPMNMKKSTSCMMNFNDFSGNQNYSRNFDMSF